MGNGGDEAGYRTAPPPFPSPFKGFGDRPISPREYRAWKGSIWLPNRAARASALPRPASDSKYSIQEMSKKGMSQAIRYTQSVPAADKAE